MNDNEMKIKKNTIINKGKSLKRKVFIFNYIYDRINKKLMKIK